MSSLRSPLELNLGSFMLDRGSPNTVAYPILLFGAFAAGLKATLANAAYTPPELAYQYQDRWVNRVSRGLYAFTEEFLSGASIVITYPALLPVVLKMFESLGIDAKQARQRIVIAGWGLSDKGPKGFIQMEDLLGTGSLEKEERFDGPLAHETTLLCYSSGTTGKPKGVEVSVHVSANLCSLILHFTATDYAQELGLMHEHDSGYVLVGIRQRYHDRCSSFLPHLRYARFLASCGITFSDDVVGLLNLVHACFLHGVPVVVVPRFEPVAFCKIIEKYKITFIFIVPPILVVLSRHPGQSFLFLRILDP